MNGLAGQLQHLVNFGALVPRALSAVCFAALAFHLNPAFSVQQDSLLNTCPLQSEELAERQIQTGDSFFYHGFRETFPEWSKSIRLDEDFHLSTKDRENIWKSYSLLRSQAEGERIQAYVKTIYAKLATKKNLSKNNTSRDSILKRVFDVILSVEATAHPIFDGRARVTIKELEAFFRLSRKQLALPLSEDGVSAIKAPLRFLDAMPEFPLRDQREEGVVILGGSFPTMRASMHMGSDIDIYIHQAISQSIAARALAESSAAGLRPTLNDYYFFDPNHFAYVSPIWFSAEGDEESFGKNIIYMHLAEIHPKTGKIERVKTYRKIRKSFVLTPSHPIDFLEPF